MGGAEGGGMLTLFKLWPGAYSEEEHRNNGKIQNSTFLYNYTCNRYYNTGKASRLVSQAGSTLVLCTV